MADKQIFYAEIQFRSIMFVMRKSYFQELTVII